MNAKQILCFLMLISSAYACTGDKPKIEQPEEKHDFHKNKPERTTSTDGKDIKLHVTAKVCIMRAAPDPSAEEVTRLKEGEVLDYLNILTTYTTPMKIQGIEYDEPWLRAVSNAGKVGWIYAGTVSFEGISDKKLAEMVFDRRLYKLFGDDITSELKVYQKEIEQVETLPAFRMLYRRSEDLKKAMDKIVNEKLAIAPKDSLPDFFWINEAFPGFLVHLVNDNKSYRIFRNFAFWNRLSQETEAENDDLFVQAFLLAYQSDSIEFTHADWRLELEDEAYSLLGRGIHIAVLNAIEKALEENDDFKPELMKLKSILLDDISFSKDFWEPKEKALKELEAMLKTDYKIIQKAERVELASKKRKLMDPAKNGLRTGLYEGNEN